MDTSDMLERQAIIPRVHATSKRHALNIIAEAAARLYGVRAADAADAFMQRELQGSTGVGLGVALPHGKIIGLERTRGVFARLEQPVAFDAIDDQPVDLIFALLGPPGDAIEHLRALSRVARALRRPDLRQQLRAARTQDALHALLVQDVTSSAA